MKALFPTCDNLNLIISYLAWIITQEKLGNNKQLYRRHSVRMHQG